MPTIACRQCSAEISTDAAEGPRCGALREWRGEGFEWKSRFMWMGFPAIHVAFGNGVDGRPRVARGAIAVGQRAVGGLAIGILAGGFFSVGVVSGGVFALGVVRVGCVAAACVHAFAPVAVGVCAFGYAVGGVAPFGWKLL